MTIGMLVTLGAALSACGTEEEDIGADGLNITEIRGLVSDWESTACGTAVTQWVPTGPDADDNAVARAYCDRADVEGTLTQKRQYLSIYPSATDIEIELRTRSCLAPMLITGDYWVAATYQQDIASDLVNAGGTLC